MIDVAHLGEVGSPKECSLADLFVKFYIHSSLAGSQVSDIYARLAEESQRRGREFQIRREVRGQSVGMESKG